MNVTLLRCTSEPEALIAEAARISHSGKFDTTKKPDDSANAELIKKLLSWGHESVFEHASATFLIEGISRTCSHQLVRHRLASFTQRSSRYCLSDVPMVYPEFQVEDNHLKEIFHKAVQNSKAAYDSLVMAGIPKEDARFVLPQAESTSLVMTANFREWRTIFKLRCSPHAQWEIRRLCKSILSKLLEEAPNVFGDLRPLACLIPDEKEDKEDPEAKKDTVPSAPPPREQTVREPVSSMSKEEFDELQSKLDGPQPTPCSEAVEEAAFESYRSECLGTCNPCNKDVCPTHKATMELASKLCNMRMKYIKPTCGPVPKGGKVELVDCDDPVPREAVIDTLRSMVD